MGSKKRLDEKMHVYVLAFHLVCDYAIYIYMMLKESHVSQDPYSKHHMTCTGPFQGVKLKSFLTPQLANPMWRKNAPQKQD